MGTSYIAPALLLLLQTVAPAAESTTHPVAPPQRDMVLWYRQPGVQWLDALPIGNGIMGAMVFGGVPHERIALNESSFWSGRPHDYDDPHAGRYFAQIRALVFAQQFQEAEKLAAAHFYGVPAAQQAYQPLGDLLLSFAGAQSVEDYRRGFVQEWIEDWQPGDQGHNVSSQFPFYPGSTIQLRRDPELSDAMRKWMDTRQGRGGWPTAWDICMWSRLERGDKVTACMRTFVSSSVAANLHNRGANQSDASFGFTAGVAEALLQSRAGGSPIVRYGEKTAPVQVKPGETVSLNADLTTPAARPRDYRFDGTISREVLENYLDRSVTMAYFLVTGKTEGNREYRYRDDDVRLIQNIGAKFIGRAIYRWNGESRLNDPNFWKDAKTLIAKVHAFDPDVIFQGCLFETISRDVERVKVPPWVFRDLGLSVEDRTFSYEAMLNQDGKLVNHWGRASVPDVTRPETQLWFYYLAGSYIDLGCEALHLGQVGLIGMADRDLKEWSRVITGIRAYAKAHARRHLVLLDAHVPTGGMIVDGVSLLDFNSFPLRIKAMPEKPHEAELQVGHLDSLYQRSKGCVSPSGWSCQSLPYLVEFDNFGRSRTPNVADTRSIFVWGWDEISWFSLQSEEYRNEFLVYAYDWLQRTDPNGHLQMPVSRMLSCPNESQGSYRANTRSPSCPLGYSQEETIKQIWNDNLRQTED